MSSFDALVSKLREIFQIDRPELDFGVYRILNVRAGEIDAYLSTRLKAQVAEAFTVGAAANTDALAKELTDKIAQYEADGVIPDSVPAVQKLREAIAAASTGASEHENQVFSHLLTFFSRYYDKGDFISQRRYKGDTYAIPYSGEEVVLHWANKDQYYTKSGEAFSNYGFKLEDGRTVQFRLVAADTAKDNRKDNDKERRFVLAEARTVARIGVINIGDDAGFFKIAEVVESFDTETDDFGSALFGTINLEGSKLNVLIGSRKFTEGWSSWRVSTMGLLNMGQGEGSQIIQLFGRGVRLKGRGMSLKRSLPHERPKGVHLERLETLNIFGVRANYMAAFKDYLKEEGITPSDEIIALDFPTKSNLPAGKRLKTLKLKDGYKDNQIKGFKRTHFPWLYEVPEDFVGKIKLPTATLDLYPLMAPDVTGSLPLKMRPIAFDSPSEVQFVRDLEAFYNSPVAKETLAGRSLYLLRNADTQAKGLGFARAGNFYPDFLLWLVDDASGKQWLSFIDPKGIRNIDLSDPKLGLFSEIKRRELELGDADLTLNAFILSFTPYRDLLNVGISASEAELEDRHVLFMDNGRDYYLGKLFDRINASASSL
ncbi:MAG: hypothetical protein A3H25_07825 [Sphingomonadales bacterium RIFCSPLOWO2_12_FULL_63_15]|nr:MAG: hypothetical protein A3H25_07825 [Sphingomonadales bacterium RIFCSPLOWO2_12_FULL_63_15]